MKAKVDIAEASRELLGPLRRAPLVISSPGEVDAERERVVPEIAILVRGAPRARATARDRRRFRTQALAAAAVLVLGVGAVLEWPGSVSTEARAPEPGATVVEGRLMQGSRFVGGAAIETPRDASARLVTESGVEVVLSHASRARLHPDGQRQRVDLVDGEVTLSVPKLRSGASVAVVTPDATVTVHGTRFSVSYEATTPGPATCVRVAEGVVSVDRRGDVEMLRAGQSSGCERGAAPDQRNEPSSQPAAVAGRSDSAAARAAGRAERSASAPARVGSAPSDPTSTLEQENQLLLAGLAAERRGDAAAARTALAALIARYPRSPLVEDARAALTRIEHGR